LGNGWVVKEKGNYKQAVVVDYGTTCHSEEDCRDKGSPYPHCCNNKVCCTDEEYNALDRQACHGLDDCPGRLYCKQDGSKEYCSIEVYTEDERDEPGNEWVIVLICVLCFVFLAIGITVGVFLCCLLNCGPCKKKNRNKPLCCPGRRGDRQKKKKKKSREQPQRKPQTKRKTKSVRGATRGQQGDQQRETETSEPDARLTHRGILESSHYYEMSRRRGEMPDDMEPNSNITRDRRHKSTNELNVSRVPSPRSRRSTTKRDSKRASDFMRGGGSRRNHRHTLTPNYRSQGGPADDDGTNLSVTGSSQYDRSTNMSDAF